MHANVRPPDPRALRRFALQLSALLLLGTAWLAWRGRLSGLSTGIALVVLASFVIVAWSRPAWIRPLHTGSMGLSRWLGERMGRVILTVFFFAVLTPIGLVLRLVGYDPLALRPRREAKSYWQPAGKPSRLDHMF